jgi:hypothetical protein
MKTAGFISSLIVLAAFSIPSALAQEVQHAPDGGTMTRIQSIFISPIKDAPFTATVTTNWVRHLDDGTTITMKNHRTVARDSAGRTFQERRAFSPNGDVNETELTQTEYRDPVAHTEYVCNPSGQVCQLRYYAAPRTTVAAMLSNTSAAGPGGPSVEDLGHNTIEGFDVVGSRETTTVAQGKIGNDHALSIVKEFWFSPALGLNLTVSRNDPRSGVENFAVGSIVASDPQPSTFTPPSDYKIIDLRSVPQN